MGLHDLAIITRFLISHYCKYLLIFLECCRKHFHVSLVSGFSQLPCRTGRAHISYPDKAGARVVSEAMRFTSLLVPVWRLEQGVCGQCHGH